MSPPPTQPGGAPPPQERPARARSGHDQAARWAQDSHAARHAVALRRRRAASLRCAPLKCGRRDPLDPVHEPLTDAEPYEAAQRYKHDDRPVSIYYVGDYDPAGLEIEAHLGMKLHKHSGRDDITLHRLGCTAEQVQLFDLPGTAPKKASYRDPASGLHIPWSGQAVEVEALDPNYLRDLVGNAITSHIDPHHLALHRMAEDQERAGLEALAGGWQL